MKYGKSRNPEGRPNFYRKYMETFLATKPDSFTVHDLMAWILHQLDGERTCGRSTAHRLINEQLRLGTIRVWKKYRMELVHYYAVYPKATVYILTEGNV